MGAPNAAQFEQAPPMVATLTQGQISVEMLTGVTSDLARLDQRVEHLGDLVRMSDSRVMDAMRSTEARLGDGIKALDGRMEGFGKTVEVMKADVDDLVHWKHKVWGMVILGGALITIATALWAFIGNRVQWKSDVVTNVPALTVSRERLAP